MVLKVGLPDPQFADEVGTIARARGRGYVQLLAPDVSRHAMLLEALGPSMATLDMTPEAQLEVMCRLLHQAWEVPRAVTGRYAEPVDKAGGLNEFLGGFSAELDRPCSESGCVFVDPVGFIGDPAYDLGVTLRDWCPQLLASDDPQSLARRYCRLLAGGSGLDEEAIWERGFLDLVTTGLLRLVVGRSGPGPPGQRGAAGAMSTEVGRGLLVQCDDPDSRRTSG